jgi:hypothetical protein
MKFIIIGAFVLAACVQTPAYVEVDASTLSEMQRCENVSLKKFPPDIILVPSSRASLSSKGLVLENSSTARREIFKRQQLLLAERSYPKKGEMSSDDFFIKYGSRPREFDLNEERRHQAYLVCRGLA